MDIYSEEFVQSLVKVKPNSYQLSILDMGYYNFIHFGINTFTKKEWGSGSEPLSNFKLESLDTDKWVLDLQATGSKGVIITAKHHDGFCLFPSKYTDYTIANTSFMGGKGDIVASLAKSCNKYGFKLGIYLSPWDRHEPTYGSDAYNDFFCNQLEELCTNYGDIFCFWFDGACGEGKDGKKQIYDWPRYYKIIRTLQPKAVISNCGPDLRWIGNENGKARASEWSVVSSRLQAYDEIAKISQQQGGATVMSKPISATDQDLGSRETLVGENLCYYPSEMDISVTRIGWFYRPLFERLYTRSVANLVKCYNTSVGNNATLLVNVPPNTHGELPRKYIARLIKARKSIEQKYAHSIKADFSQVDDYTYELKFDRAKLSRMVIAEDISFSQRVESFSVFSGDSKIYQGTTIGFKKFCEMKVTKIDKLTIHIDSCRLEPHIAYIKLYS